MIPQAEYARVRRRLREKEGELKDLRSSYDELREEHRKFVQAVQTSDEATAGGGDKGSNAQQGSHLRATVSHIQGRWLGRLAEALDIHLGKNLTSHARSSSHSLSSAGSNGSSPAKPANSGSALDFATLSNILKGVENLKRKLSLAQAGEDEGTGSGTGTGGKAVGDSSAEPGTKHPLVLTMQLNAKQHGIRGLSNVNGAHEVLEAARRAEMEETVAGTGTLPGFDGRWVSGPDPLFQRGMPPVPLSAAIFQPRFFVGRGIGPSVPRFLRATGLVRHRELSKKACERLVKECWISKQKAEDTLRRRKQGNAAPSGVASRRRAESKD